MEQVADALPCPDCGRPLPDPVPAACPHCALRLRGVDARRLWQLEQELVGIEARRREIAAERVRLIEGLHRPEVPATSGTAPVTPVAPAGRTLSVQQLLLGLGGVLLLSALGFFGLVMWLVVGVWGQALILLVLTGAAAAGAVAFNRRGLAAAAETFALLTAGLVLMDATALRFKGLLGLDGVTAGAYGAVAAVVGALVLLAVDRAAGDRPRRMVSLRPVAAGAAALVPWLVASTLDADSAGVPLAFAGIAVAEVALAVVVHRCSRRARRLRSPSLLVVALALALAILCLEVSALVLAFDVDRDLGPRYAAWALAMVPVLALGVAAARLPSGLPARGLLAAGVTVGSVVLAGVPLVDAPWWSLPIVAVLAAGVVLAPVPWPARAVAAVVGLATYPVLLLLAAVDHSSVRAWGRASFDSSGGAHVAPEWAMVCALAAAVVCGVLAWRERARDDPAAFSLLVVGMLASAAAVELAFLLGRSEGWWYAVALTDVVVLGLLAARAVLRGGPRSATVELLALVSGAGAAVLAYAAAVDLDDEQAGWHLVALFAVLGVGGLAYALLPRRFPASYVGSAGVSISWWILLATRADELPIELFTLPAALVVGAVGLVQARRLRGRGAPVPSLAVAGPALGLALLPSVQVGLADADAVRLGVVTLVAVVLVLLGVATRTLAPVLLGGFAIVEIAVVQGGPYLGDVPFWLTGGIAGAILIWAGVRWEATVAAGKRSAVWLESLR